MTTREELEERLDSFDARERADALDALIVAHAGELPPEGGNVNMHSHSFFSYNALGYSPSRIIWEARKAGLYAAGLCDFDVLDGLEEFLEAGRKLALRVTVNLETRAYLKEFGEVDINSPGEPGVTYVMGAGFARMPESGTPADTELAAYRERARRRNIELVERINARLPDIAIDYEKDVLPLSPSGSATERHIVSAYINASHTAFEHARPTAEFWARILNRSLDETVELMADRPALEGDVRAALVKRGGLGYVAPSPETFPLVDDFIEWVLSCRAVPMVTWLDGTSAGEQNGRRVVECQMEKGAAALNIIPDRNWNVSDPAERAVKQQNLRDIVTVAEDLKLPVNIGTEMNKMGLPLVDDLSGEVLSEFSRPFLRGAQIMVGHTLLLRYADLSYTDERAADEFDDVDKKNRFFAAVGALPALTEAQVAELEQMGPEKAFAWFRDAVG